MVSDGCTLCYYRRDCCGLAINNSHMNGICDLKGLGYSLVWLPPTPDQTQLFKGVWVNYFTRHIICVSCSSFTLVVVVVVNYDLLVVTTWSEKERGEGEREKVRERSEILVLSGGLLKFLLVSSQHVQHCTHIYHTCMQFIIENWLC